MLPRSPRFVGRPRDFDWIAEPRRGPAKGTAGARGSSAPPPSAEEIIDSLSDVGRRDWSRSRVLEIVGSQPILCERLASVGAASYVALAERHIDLAEWSGRFPRSAFLVGCVESMAGPYRAVFELVVSLAAPISAGGVQTDRVRVGGLARLIRPGGQLVTLMAPIARSPAGSSPLGRWLGPLGLAPSAVRRLTGGSNLLIASRLEAKPGRAAG